VEVQAIQRPIHQGSPTREGLILENPEKAEVQETSDRIHQSEAVAIIDAMIWGKYLEKTRGRDESLTIHRCLTIWM